jgi:AraC-like DNA-binding protein
LRRPVFAESATDETKRDTDDTAERALSRYQKGDPPMRGSPAWGQPVTQDQSEALHFTTAAPPCGVATERFSTDDWPEHQRRSAAADFYAGVFRQDVEPIPGEPFLMHGRIRHIPGLRLMSAKTLGLVARRRAEHVSNDDVLISIILEGERIVTHRGREFVVRSGEAQVCNDAEPGAITIPNLHRYISLRIPANAVARDAKIKSHRSHIVPSRNEALGLLRGYLPVLAGAQLQPTSEAWRLAVTHVQDLVTMMVAPPHRSAEIAERPGSHAARLHALKDDVLRNLEHGDVSIDAISARHRMSPRQVQRLFGREGSTFSEFVLERRLAFAHRLLTDPRRSAEKIASIAFTAGFGDVSYFYRVFRRRYDVLPSDVRAMARRDH